MFKLSPVVLVNPSALKCGPEHGNTKKSVSLAGWLLVSGNKTEKLVIIKYFWNTCESVLIALQSVCQIVLWRTDKHFFFNLFHWSLVDLQCCADLCCTAEWLSHPYICILFHILFLCILSQDIKYSSLCYTVELCCLSILYIIVCIC